MENLDNKCKSPKCENNKHVNSLYCTECNKEVSLIIKYIDDHQHEISKLVDTLTDNYGIVFENGELDEE